MHSRMKVTRNRAEVTLISRHGGTPLAWVLLLEIAILGTLNLQLASVLPDIWVLWLPALASLALVAWTARQIRPDFRITLSPATRTGRLVRIAPLTGTRTTALFEMDAIESLRIEQTTAGPLELSRTGGYVVAIELRGGARYVLSTRGPLLAYKDSVARFARAAGLGSRFQRLPAG